MKQTFLKLISVLAVLMAVGGMQISVSGQSDEGHEPSLVGVWLTQVTRRNCDTGEPIAATNRIQWTFAEGGTLLETVGPSIFRSPGNGIWKRELERVFLRRTFHAIRCGRLVCRKRGCKGGPHTRRDG